MKFFWILLLIPSFIFSHQKKTTEKLDSIGYYIQLANFNKKTNNYKFSLLYSQKAYNYAKRNTDIKGKALSQFSLGTTYFELKKTADAIDSFSKSAANFSLLPPPSSLQALCYYNIGLCYMALKEYDSAEVNFNRAKIIYNSIKIDASESIKLQKGILYESRGENELASKLFNEIISKPDREDVFKTKAEAMYQLGRIEEKFNRNNLAINYLNRSLLLNLKDNNLEQKAKIYLALSSIYEKLFAIKKSHYYLKENIKLKDSILNLNTQKLSDSDYAEFKESERMNIIKQMNKKNNSQQKAIKFVKLISILGVALISILSLLSLSLYKNNIIRNQSNILLKEKNLELQIAKDKAEKASQARAEFLSTVSHELRTPLNAINGITHLLLEEKPKKSQLHYLNSLKFSGNYLLTFINEILEINKIEYSTIEIEYIDFNIKQLLRDIQNSFKEIADKNNNRFTIEIDESIPDILIGDTTKISQIFMNLINNALKFTKKGEVKVISKLISIDEETTTLHFEVSDTGIGIPEEKLKTVFDSFSQGSIEINRKYGGTGLGLTIVKKLVELLGGDIKLNSHSLKNHYFKFQLK
jgi:signal transduction histidine kinase